MSKNFQVFLYYFHYTCNYDFDQFKAMPHGSEKSPEKNRNEIHHSLCMPHGRGKIVVNYEENDT